MLSVYLAGRYRWAAQLETVALKLRELPFVKIASSWHWQVRLNWMPEEEFSALMRKRDIEGVRACDLLLFFRMPPGRPVKIPPAELVRGGRFVELGIALALGKRIFIFGRAPKASVSLFEIDDGITSFYDMRAMLGMIGDMASTFSGGG